MRKSGNCTIGKAKFGFERYGFNTLEFQGHHSSIKVAAKVVQV
jgi:hypothetical protein